MLEKSDLSLVDALGTLYIGKHKVYRGIYGSNIDDVTSLLNCGLIAELTKLKLFPETRVSQKKILGYNLVIEHEKIKYVTYPYEWSPTMLRDAGNVILKVNELANKYGYELKDAHPFNILYNYNKPIFVDFGSFKRKNPSNSNAWIALEEFIRSYYYTLYLHSKGARYFAFTSFVRSGGLIPHIDFLKFKYCLSNFFPKSILERLLSYIYAYKKILLLEDDYIDTIIPIYFSKIIKFLKRKSLLPFVSINYSALSNKLNKLNLTSRTQWSGYHVKAGFYNNKEEIVLTPRMMLVLEWINKYKIKTVLELAGNQGILARKIAEIDSVESVICSDYDEEAIGILHKHLKSSESKILPLVLDFMLPLSNGNLQQPDKRLKSEIVTALAVTHHLILSQHFKLEFILHRLLNFTEKYLIIEFMPLGLFDGKSASPLPDWYTRDWFISELSKYFMVLEEKKVEANRILYMSEKKSRNYLIDKM